jgi:methylphosphotriester-DNA--protein-cysteine methyltransferase
VRTAQAILRVGRKRNDTRRGREVIFPLQGNARASKPTRAARIVQKAQSYGMEHLGEEFQLRKVSQYCCVSQSNLSRIFGSSCGVSFTEFVLQTRIRKAIELLIVLEIPVKLYLLRRWFPRSFLLRAHVSALCWNEPYAVPDNGRERPSRDFSTRSTHELNQSAASS